MSATVASLVATVLDVLADMSAGYVGTKSGGGCPIQTLFGAFWNNAKGLRDVHGVTEEAVANIVPES